VWVFGGNNSGELGLGDTNTRLIPPKIPNFNVKSIVAGTNHTVALDFNDEVWINLKNPIVFVRTFGRNYSGQLGLNDRRITITPTKIPSGAFGLPKVKSIFAGEDRTMAIDFNNDVWVNFALTL
jgi:alpha-tubulin suppressor-like RCC1 family protein